MVFCVGDLLLAAARRNVVRIEVKDLFVSLKRKIVSTGLVITVGLSEQLLYFFDFTDERRRDRFVEISRLM